MMPALRRPASVLLAASILVLAGCTGSAPSDDPGESGPSGEVVVYAAASLAGAFDAVGEAFVAHYPGVSVSAIYDGSSTLATQLGEGAPADVFASADEANMQRVGEYVDEPSVFASNTLVIAVPEGNPGGVEGLADLTDIVTVLCAAEVPCGASSAALLQAADVPVEPASVEQNVTAVLTKVAAGEADAGLVYATDVIDRADVEAIVPDGAAEVVNRYPIAALADARNPEAADAFVTFVMSDAGQAILADFGFGAP